MIITNLDFLKEISRFLAKSIDNLGRSVHNGFCKGDHENLEENMEKVGTVVPANIVKGVVEGKSAWQKALEKALNNKETK